MKVIHQHQLPNDPHLKDAFHPQRMLSQQLIDALHKSKRVLLITGAGISTSAGIPDFRSIQGMYARLKERWPSLVLKGKDLFDASLFRRPETTELFYIMMGEMWEATQSAQFTPTHQFIHELWKQGKLLRCFTQNIDGLEEQLGMSIGMDKKDPIVPLHGSLKHMRCTHCSHRCMIHDYVHQLKSGQQPPCPRCTEMTEIRQAQQKRALPVGFLRPDIVLYEEHHPHGDQIAQLIEGVLGRCDFVLVMGTSLKIPGVQAMVKRVSRLLKERNQLRKKEQPIQLVLVNQTDLTVSKEWAKIFDLVWVGDTDTMVLHVQKGLEDRQRADALKKQARVFHPGPAVPKSKMPYAARKETTVSSSIIVDKAHVQKVGSLSVVKGSGSKKTPEKSTMKAKPPLVVSLPSISHKLPAVPTSDPEERLEEEVIKITGGVALDVQRPSAVRNRRRPLSNSKKSAETVVVSSDVEEQFKAEKENGHGLDSILTNESAKLNRGRPPLPLKSASQRPKQLISLGKVVKNQTTESLKTKNATTKKEVSTPSTRIRREPPSPVLNIVGGIGITVGNVSPKKSRV